MSYDTFKVSNENGDYSSEVSDGSVSSTDLQTSRGKPALAYVTIRELPINGNLSIDGMPLYMSQKFYKKDLARLKFTTAYGVKYNYYGNFNIVIHDGEESAKKHSFVIDVATINAELGDADQDGESTAGAKENDGKDTLSFIAKRKSDFEVNNDDFSWVDATSPVLFEED